MRISDPFRYHAVSSDLVYVASFSPVQMPPLAPQQSPGRNLTGGDRLPVEREPRPRLNPLPVLIGISSGTTTVERVPGKRRSLGLVGAKYTVPPIDRDPTLAPGF
jgi:hypothetical protein